MFVAQLCVKWGDGKMEFIGPREAKKGISLKAGGLKKSKSKVKKRRRTGLMEHVCGVIFLSSYDKCF